MSTFCQALKPTPILNTSCFKEVFGAPELPLDEASLFRPLEMIALPETKFQIHQFLEDGIYQVSTNEYPHGSYFIDSRFCSSPLNHAPERKIQLPSFETILSRLESSLGYPYVWGGNWKEGIPEIMQFYNPQIDEQQPHFLAGVDCSGLLYQATNGFTPRNTSELFHFGKIVPTFNDVKPLDIIVWPGHVLIFLTPSILIESAYGKGVVLTSLADRRKEFSSYRYVIRRFFS